jgi:hypothetical protein
MTARCASNRGMFVRWHRVAVVVAALAGVAMTPLAGLAAEDIPSGQFFTEALPDRDDGGGFTVQDGHGAKLWTAFKDAGGVDTLGYPVSRRFDWDNGVVAQAFEHGILVWDADDNHADLRDLSELPNKELPREATQPDQPPRAEAETEAPAWSGWWWPASDGVGPTLYAPNSPLDKYDRYVAAVTGDNPGTRDWEHRELYFPASMWAGHCNGFAAAALLEPEPTEPVDVLGITFAVADLKGLLVDYHFGDAAAWSFGEETDLNPADFHRMLLEWLRTTGKGFVLTFDLGGGEVWSYPVYRFSSEWSPDAAEADVWHVTTTVWMADMDVPVDFVGTRPFPSATGKTFEYTLRGDPRNPGDGAWTGTSKSGRFAHPGRIWYPEPLVRNAARELVSPGLDRQTVANILSGSDGSGLAGSAPGLRLRP